MRLIYILQKGSSYRMNGTVELLADDVVEDDGAGTEFFLNLGVIREVDADHLEAGVGVAAAVQYVAGEDVGLGARDEVMVGRVSRKHLLQLWHP